MLLPRLEKDAEADFYLCCLHGINRFYQARLKLIKIRLGCNFVANFNCSTLKNVLLFIPEIRHFPLTTFKITWPPSRN